MTTRAIFSAPTSNHMAATRTSVLSYVRKIIEVRKQRAALAKLDDAALQDLGITRFQAESEVRRKIWDIPSNRIC